MQYHAIPCKTMQYHAKPCHTMQYHAISCNAMQYHAIPCNTMQYHAIPCNTMQYNAIPCNTMQYHDLFNPAFFFASHSMHIIFDVVADELTNFNRPYLSRVIRALARGWFYLDFDIYRSMSEVAFWHRDCFLRLYTPFMHLMCSCIISLIWTLHCVTKIFKDTN